MVNKLINKYLVYQYRKVESFVQHPVQTQNAVLKELIHCGRDTYFGQQNKLNQVQHREHFRSLVPLSQYETLRPYLDLIINEKRSNVLWNTPVRWFAMSSGTTEDRSKYIPVTKESLQAGHYRCGQQMLSMYARHFPNSKYLLGKTLVIGGSKQLNQIGDGIYTGDISAILIKNLMFWAKYSRTPENIALLSDWEEKLNALTKYALRSDIRAFMGVPSWLLILLRRIREVSGQELNDLFPHLEVFFHGGVSFAPYQEQYNQLIDSTKMQYWETYNASEGFFGVQFSPDSKDMLLMLDSGVYYEFIPASEWDKPNPKTLCLDEVQLSENYELVITTNGGLWRYRIGDTIEFTNLQPYLFRITGRTKSFINAFGEEVIVDNANKAVAAACKATNAIVAEYTAAPIYLGDTDGGAHEWLIEFEREPSDMELFTRKLDEALQEVNSDYQAKRAYNLSLQVPVVQSLPKDTFIRWMESEGRLGGQNKVPKLSNNRKYSESILLFVNKIRH